jgi:HD superfamily phosphohydrolase
MIARFVRWCLVCVVCLPVWAVKVETFYGPIDVDEPVILELIDSTPFQRLKEIHQYGVSYYTTHREEYTRYAHSLGVFAILRAKGCSLDEQLAGLLHDVSHTVFSHVGDWIFGKEQLERDYQGGIHTLFLKQTGIEKILKRHNMTVERMQPTQEMYPALEQKCPDLCADRIDYNIQGAYYQGFITYDEAMEIFHNLKFVDGIWISSRPDLMKKLSRFSIFMTEACWGSPTNHVASRALADAILQGIEIGAIAFSEIHISTDHTIWHRLLHHPDPIIQKKMKMVFDAPRLFTLVSPAEADMVIRSKFRGIDPWIVQEEKRARLTALDSAFRDEFLNAKKRIEAGYPIKLL